MSRNTFLIALSFLGPGDVFVAQHVCKEWGRELSLITQQLKLSAKHLVARTPVLHAAARLARSKGRREFDPAFWAAYYGYGEVLKWLQPPSLWGPKMSASVRSGAACGGHIHILDFEREVCPTWATSLTGAVVIHATAANYVHVLDWWWESVPAIHRSEGAILQFSGVYSAFKDAALLGCRMGSLDCLRWLSRHGGYFDATSCQTAANAAQLEVLVWLGEICVKDHYICGGFISSLRSQAIEILAELKEGAPRPQYTCVASTWDNVNKKSLPPHFAPVVPENEELKSSSLPLGT